MCHMDTVIVQYLHQLILFFFSDFYKEFPVIVVFPSL